jgi:hypothetical protein
VPLGLGVLVLIGLASAIGLSGAAAVLVPFAVAAFGVAAVGIGWSLIGRRTFDVPRLAAPQSVARGDTVSLELRVTPRRTVHPTAVDWELHAEELALRRSNSGDATQEYTHTLARIQARTAVAAPWRAGAPQSVRARLVVPRGAPLTFWAGTSHSVRWTAVARVRVPRAPDLVAETPLYVEPAAAPGGGTAAGGTRLEAQDGGLRGELRLRLPARDGVPVAEPGRRLEGELRLEVAEPISARETALRLVRRAHGSGPGEELIVHEEALHQGALAPGQVLTVPVRLDLPQTRELSYRGHHVQCEWLIEVRVDRPGRDVHLRFPLWVRAEDEVEG